MQSTVRWRIKRASAVAKQNVDFLGDFNEHPQLSMFSLENAAQCTAISQNSYFAPIILGEDRSNEVQRCLVGRHFPHTLRTPPIRGISLCPQYERPDLKFESYNQFIVQEGRIGTRA